MPLPIPLAACLQQCGRRGLLAPLAAIGAGLAWPALASGAHALLPGVVACTILLSVLLAEPGRFGRRELAAALAICAANLIVTPLLLATLIPALGWPPVLLWLVLAAASPAAASAPVIAAALGLRVRLAVLAQLGSMLLAPLTLPLVATLLDGPVLLEPWPLLRRTLLLVLLPALAGLILRRVASGPVVARVGELRGLAVLALCALGAAQAHGLPGLLRTAPSGEAATLILGALGAAALGAAVAAGLAALCRGDAAGVGFCVGAARNVSSVWAAAAHQLPPSGALALQLALGCTFLGPALFAAARAWPRRRRAHSAARCRRLTVLPGLLAGPGALAAPGSTHV